MIHCPQYHTGDRDPMCEPHTQIHHTTTLLKGDADVSPNCSLHGIGFLDIRYAERERTHSREVTGRTTVCTVVPSPVTTKRRTPATHTHLPTYLVSSSSPPSLKQQRIRSSRYIRLGKTLQTCKSIKEKAGSRSEFVCGVDPDPGIHCSD
jgi:hypothetical protein